MQTPRLPVSVRILASRFRVRTKPWDGLFRFPLEGSDEYDLLGQTSYSPKLIQLREVSPEVVLDRQRETMLHEVLHATIHAAGMDFMFEGDQEEHVVTALAPHLLAVMKENHRLMAYLIGRNWL